MALFNYQSPVSQLLTCGAIKHGSDWRNYTQEFKLTLDDIPELLRLATDPIVNSWNSESVEVWGPAHAWRALSQFGTASLQAIAPLFKLLIDCPEDDYLADDLSTVVANIGPLAIPEIKTFLETCPKNEYRPIWVAIEGLEKIAERYPESRSLIFDTAIDQLAKYRHNDSGTNGFILGLLCKLENPDALPLIEKVFFEGKVDTDLVSWEDIQIAFDITQPAPSSDNLREFLKFQPRERDKPKGFGTSSPQAKSKKKPKR